ncbi:MAG: class I tRNA ligase family protein, partial [Candidatus Pacebacteria bacterium]|nr:class I tRNA ligase family protein [Candidatus Paceibacterota bacterium]
YRLQDWVFSRQRYWGEPIPIIHCEKCGAVPIPEEELPIELPDVKNYEPTGTGESPLAGIDEWVNTACPKCGGEGKRETNTMPQWAGSSWYYLRYIDPKNDKELISKDKDKYWSPVDFYVGGAEHATRHLIYARFWHKFLFDIGVLNYDEPFERLQHVGLILAEDGRKMSKRWGNVINPDEIVEIFGADSMRVYEMFMGPFSQSGSWSTNGLVGARRFLEKIWKISENLTKTSLQSKEVRPNISDRKCFRKEDSKSGEDLIRELHKTIKKVEEDIEEFKLNTAVSSMMKLVNVIEENPKPSVGQKKNISKESFEVFLKILAPFAPHITEEIWNQLGHTNSIHLEEWPKYDAKLAKDDTYMIAIQVNGKIRSEVEIKAGTSEKDLEKVVLADEKIQKWIGENKVKKTIYVENKLFSIVI